MNNRKNIALAMIITTMLFLVVTLVRSYILLPSDAKQYTDFFIDNNIDFVKIYLNDRDYYSNSDEELGWDNMEYLINEYDKLQFNKSISAISNHLDSGLIGDTVELDFTSYEFNYIYGTYPKNENEVVLTRNMAQQLLDSTNSRVDELLNDSVAFDESTSALANLNTIEDLVGTKPFIKGTPNEHNMVELQNALIVAGSSMKPQ